MKKILVIFLASTFVLAMVSLAFGSRYNTPLWSTGVSPFHPHGGYADTTDKCKDCHAVHLAQSNYKLLRAGSTSAEPCTFCHGSGGASTKIIILNTSGHGGSSINENSVVAPDDTTPAYTASTTNPFNCATCHSVHNRNTIFALTDSVNPGTTNRMLKFDPDNNSADSIAYSSGDTVQLTNWCKNCHASNDQTFGYGSQTPEAGGTTTSYGHTAGTAGIQTIAYANGLTTANVRVGGGVDLTRAARCNQCHAAGAGTAWVSGQVGQVQTGAVGNQTVVFPHSGYTGSYSLLKNSPNLTAGASGALLDDVCNDCHYTPSLP